MSKALQQALQRNFGKLSSLVTSKTYKNHSVWKSQKKSNSILRAKRATFTFWVDKSWLKIPKIVNFGKFLKTWSLRSNSVTKQVRLKKDKNWWKMPKFKSSNATFWVIFKQCADVVCTTYTYLYYGWPHFWQISSCFLCHPPWKLCR